MEASATTAHCDVLTLLRLLLLLLPLLPAGQLLAQLLRPAYLVRRNEHCH
jgi:hypothetical protein